MDDEDLLTAATALRQGTTRLARRLRIERPEPAQTALEMGILAHLNRRGPTTPGALAAAERVQPQSLTRKLASLERQLLAVRQPDDRDRRRSLLAITEAGRQALTRDMRRRDAWLARAMALRLTRAEQEVLRIAGELMDRLADTDVVGAERAAPTPSPAPANPRCMIPAPNSRVPVISRPARVVGWLRAQRAGSGTRPAGCALRRLGNASSSCRTGRRRRARAGRG